MPVIVASGNPLGFRALGSAGLAAVDAYDQIVSALRHRLGPEHAALFAEPSRQGIEINWYATVYSPQLPVRLIDAPAERRTEGLRRLDQLLSDITALTTQLGKSDSQSERVLAGILGNATEIPTEAQLYLVGVQPIIAFWGHVIDMDEPATGVLRTLIRRMAEGSDAPDTQPTTGSTATGRITATGTSTAAAGRPRQGFSISMAWLWLVLTLLLLTCGVELLRGCAIGLPYALTGWLLNYCSAPPGPASTLASEQAQQGALQAEYDYLVQQAAARRQQCSMPAGGGQVLPRKPVLQPIDPPKPPEPAQPDANLKLPDRVEDGPGFLEGCWQAQKGLTEVSNGKPTGHSIDTTYCFDKSGKGRRTIIVDDGAKCVGDLAATWTEGKLHIHSQSIVCNSKGHGTWVSTDDTCTRAADGEARCTEADPTDPTHPNFQDHPFSRVPASGDARP